MNPILAGWNGENIIVMYAQYNQVIVLPSVVCHEPVALVFCSTHPLSVSLFP